MLCEKLDERGRTVGDAAINGTRRTTPGRLLREDGSKKTKSCRMRRLRYRHIDLSLHPQTRMTETEVAGLLMEHLQQGTLRDLRLTQNLYRSTSQRPDAPTARARTAESTLNTRLPNTKPERSAKLTNSKFRGQHSNMYLRPRCSLKESVVMIESNPVMVVRQSLSSTRRPRLRRRLC